MLMIQQGQADGDGTDSKHDDAQHSILGPVQLLLHPGDALAGSDVNVDAGGDGQDDPHGVGGNVVDGQDDDAPQHDRQARQKVERQGPLDGQAGVLGQNKEIGQLLGNLVVQGDEQDGQGHVVGAKEETDANEDTIGKVVEGIADEDGGTERVVNGIAVVMALCISGGGQGLVLENALTKVTAIFGLAGVVLVVQGQTLRVLAILALLAVIGRSLAGSDSLVGIAILWGPHVAGRMAVAGLDQGQGTLLGLPTESRSLAAFVGTLVLVGTGEHGSQDHGKEVSAKDGTSKFPGGTLGTFVVAGVVCGK